MRDTSIEDEIDAIRLEIYEETKNMTVEEHTEYYRKVSERAAKEYGFKCVPSIDTKVDTP